MSFVSSLPANLSKYSVLTVPKRKTLHVWDSAEGHEYQIRTTHSLDYAVGVDTHIQILPDIDSAVGLETFVKSLSQLDVAVASEGLHREIIAYDLSRTDETSSKHQLHDNVRSLSQSDVATALETFVRLLSQSDRALLSEGMYRKIVTHDSSRADEVFSARQLGADGNKRSDTDHGRGEETSVAKLAPKYFDLQTWKITTTPTSLSVYIGIGGVSGCVVVAGVKLCYKKLGDVLDWETLQNLLEAFKRIDDKVKTWIDIINEILSEQP